MAVFWDVTLYQRANSSGLLYSPLHKEGQQTVRAVSDGIAGRNARKLTPFLPIALVVSGAQSEYFSETSLQNDRNDPHTSV